MHSSECINVDRQEEVYMAGDSDRVFSEIKTLPVSFFIIILSLIPLTVKEISLHFLSLVKPFSQIESKEILPTELLKVLILSTLSKNREKKPWLCNIHIALGPQI